MDSSYIPPPPISDWASVQLARLRMAILKGERRPAQLILNALFHYGVYDDPRTGPVATESWVSEVFDERTVCKLERIGVMKIKDLYQISQERLRSLKGFGPGTVKEINCTLRKKFGKELKRNPNFGKESEANNACDR